jgi:hypothetical protein
MIIKYFRDLDAVGHIVSLTIEPAGSNPTHRHPDTSSPANYPFPLASPANITSTANTCSKP